MYIKKIEIQNRKSEYCNMFSNGHPFGRPFGLQTIILCDDVNFTPNIGNVIRNAGLLGCDAAIFSNNEKYTTTFKRNVEYYSMGNPSSLPVFYNLSVTDVILEAIFNGYKIVVLETGGPSVLKADLTAEKLLFIVGSERYGVGKQVLKAVEKGYAEIVTIPTTIDSSLNVSFAATLAVYERMRQLTVS